ncbi:MAG TPA: carboxypeptidase regulatory-like domain-containing protein, partial [Thermoleophilia bacterium]
DFWTSVGGEYKASIDFVAHLKVESGATFVRGPQVRTQTLRTGLSDGPPGSMTELHRVGGTVRDGAGIPVGDAWVVLPGTGRWTATDPDGRFRLGRIPAGAQRVVVRTAGGEAAEASIDVPGGQADLVVGDRPRTGAKRAKRPG